MPYDVVTISNIDSVNLLASKENQYMDYKAIDIAPGKLTKHLSAFANADGGELFIGCDEQSGAAFVWRGFATPEDANGHVQAFEAVFPFGQDSSYEFLQCPSQVGLILHVIVRKTKDVRYASDGKRIYGVTPRACL